MTFLQHILKLQPLAAWKWLSTCRQKDPESEGDQPSPVTLDEYLPGFEEAAAFISAEDEGSMCRRSRRLTARNLLYMQSELASRKDKLHRMNQGGRRKIDTSEGVSALQCGTDRDSLRRLQSTDDEVRERLALIKDIRKLVKEYDTDRLTRLIEQSIVKSQIKWFREKRNVRHSWQGVYYIPDHMIEVFVSIFAVTTAASLLIGGIAALDSAQARNVRLGILAPFIVAFAAFVGLLTTAKRSELFAATAAYAAVLVVYVGKAS
ncbi:hypothetical protein KC340_g16562 [Hortaea werneckii]|nr:hypothetical protein KC342_g16880 [Hortaea werneckii]KAI7059264.1 hypothetical protein KC339_g17397 [Hortaea werneckii]KAI7209874.1 hypothetical protein KC365_g15506 [Hortaea werneckii]KAI7293138.1 hypothetical protein KC340_g16562 [Hortaea werneckii]KAI7376045.1 hypothetical protein KC328_g15080 [Hortaea werneckii]